LVLSFSIHENNIYVLTGTYHELLERSTEFSQIIRDHVTNNHEDSSTNPAQHDTLFVNAQGATISQREEKSTSKTGQMIQVKEPPRKLMTVGMGIHFIRKVSRMLMNN
jgi:hypothetical protein